jgi:hypothetical protein
MQLAEGRVTQDQIPQPVEMGDAGTADKPARRKPSAKKKTHQAASRVRHESVSATPVS